MKRVCLTVFVLLACASPALAARRPTRAQRLAIIAALHRAHISHPVRWIRISTAAPGWAEAELGQNRAAILRRRGGRWRVLVVGGLGIGCRVPFDVRRDLHVIC